MPFPLHCRAQVLGINIIATIPLPMKMDRLLLTWEPAGCLRSGFPHIWFSLLDKYTALYWMSHPRVSPHFIGLLCHYSHSTSCFSKVETGSLTAERCFFQLKYCSKNSCKLWWSIICDCEMSRKQRVPLNTWDQSVEAQVRAGHPPPANPFVQSWEQGSSLKLSVGPV